MSGKVRSADQCLIDQFSVKFYEDLDRDINQLLKIATKANKITQKLFTIDGIKVAIVYNPTKRTVTVLPGTTISDKVLLLSEKKLPQSIVDKIRATIPSELGMAQAQIAKVGNKTVFQRLELE